MTDAPDPDAPEMRAAARRTVAKYAENADDCALLLAVLGLDESGPPLCRECGEPIARLAAGGYNQSAGGGLCARCYDRAYRADHAAREAGDQPTGGHPPAKRARVSRALTTTDTTAVRAHLQTLRDSGMVLSEIAELGRVHLQTLHNIRRNDRVNKDSADRVLAVEPRPVTGPRVIVCGDCGEKFESSLRFTRCKPCRYGYVPVGPARERLQQLQRAGFSRRVSAELIGISKDMVSEIANPSVKCARTQISAVTEARILAIKVPEAVG